jgi:zinc/manganese transport system substrate-binding protein
MRSLASHILLVLLLLGSTLTAQADRPVVVGTASMFSDMAAVIGGNLIEVQTIVPIGGDPHSYEPTPGDARLVARADLILRNGLTFEGWIRELIENSGTQAEIVLITEGIEVIESETYANSADPHAWMSAANGLIYIRNIRDALTTLLPEHAEEFDFNYRLYAEQLKRLDEEISAQIASVPVVKRVLITSHDAFRYYSARYGIKVEAVLGTSTDADVQTSDIRRLNRVLQESEVPAVFIESTVNPKVLQQIARDNGVVIGGSLYADSLGDPDSPGGTYLKMLRHNTRVIVEGLSRERSTAVELVSEGDRQERLWLFGLIGLLMVGSFFFMVFKLNAGL